MNDSIDRHSLAFEYVVGTLRGEERETFAAQLRTDVALAEEVHYWETALMPSLGSVPLLEPKPETLNNILTKINNKSSSPVDEEPARFWEKLLPWKMARVAVFTMLLVFTGVSINNALQQHPSNTLNADYVAVLVNELNEPILTALTATDGSKLWLKWESWQAMKGHSLQLWSQSRRDGQVRPLLVFDGELREVTLDQATWRLIKDSSHLLITQEEMGGSAFDEPSDQVIAKGVCIRLAKNTEGA